MKTYILRTVIINSIDFPAGTIVKSLEQDKENLKLNWAYTFEVTEGPLKGEKGKIADGLAGWVIDDTPDNRVRFKKLKEAEKAIDVLTYAINEIWQSIPNAVLPTKLK